MDREVIEVICKKDENHLHNMLKNSLIKKYGEDRVKDEKGEWLIAEGDIPICLVAHLDTVFEGLPQDIFFDPKRGVMWSPEGAGFDDRAGVAAIVDIICKGYKPHIVFTHGEEIGGQGALSLANAGQVLGRHMTENQKQKSPFGILKAVFELDRQGKRDCVFYDCGNEDFIDYVKSFGFVRAEGTFSDISILGPFWEVCSVNLSVGYRREHTYMEHLYLQDLNNTIEKVCMILDAASDMPEFEYIENDNSLFKMYWNQF